MIWVALAAGIGAFFILLLRHYSWLNAAVCGIALTVVLATIAASQEGWEIPVPVLILAGATGGSLATAAADRERQRKDKRDHLSQTT